MDYINELNKINPDNSYIPENCNNIFDFGIYTNRAIMDIYNEASLSLLMDQFTIFDGVVNESIILEDFKSKMKDITKKVKDTLKTVWEKIKGFFEKIFKFIKNIFKKIQTEVFSDATENEFDKAVKYFTNDYKDSIVYFTKEVNDKDKKSTVYHYKKGFIDDCDKYNKEILDRAKGSFNYLKGIYTNANSVDIKDKNAWISGAMKERDEIIRVLKYTKPSQVYNYILFGNGELFDNFSKEDIYNAIYSEAIKHNYLEKNAFVITTDNLSKYVNDIKDSVYSNNAKKWVGVVKDGYDEAKNIVNEAIKGADFLFTTTDIHSDFIKDINVSTGKVLGQATIGPEYAIDYSNRCKDVLQVLVSVESAMNDILTQYYKSNVKIVCSIINKYWKLNNERKQVVSSVGVQPA